MIYSYIYIYVYAQLYIYIYIYIYFFIYIYVYIERDTQLYSGKTHDNKYTHIRMWIRYTHLCIYIYMYIYIYACVCLYTYIVIYVYVLYAHIHIFMYVCVKRRATAIFVLRALWAILAATTNLYILSLHFAPPPFPHESTDAQRDRSERHKTNMQAAVPTQNKYARTRQHAKQIYKHTVARKTNMASPGGTQNKYGSTRRNAKQICRLPAARKN